jgi:hypothetical protein
VGSPVERMKSTSHCIATDICQSSLLQVNVYVTHSLLNVLVHIANKMVLKKSGRFPQCIAQHNVQHLIGNICFQFNYGCSGYDFRTPNQTHDISILNLTFLFNSQIKKLTIRFQVLTVGMLRLQFSGRCTKLHSITYRRLITEVHHSPPSSAEVKRRLRFTSAQ